MEGCSRPHAVPVVYRAWNEQRLATCRIVFVDDLMVNFQATCPCVLNLLSPLTPPVDHAAYPDPLLHALAHQPNVGLRVKDLVRAPSTGLPVTLIRQLTEALSHYANIQMLVLDWDCTITTWDGLPEDLEDLFQRVTPDTIWTSMLGSLERKEAWLTLLRQGHAQKRVCILTNHWIGKAIRYTLQQLDATLADVPVISMEERNWLPKGSYIQQHILRDGCLCDRPPVLRRSERIRHQKCLPYAG